jgi:hypothetical protein
MFRAQLVLLLGLSNAWATHEATAGFGAAGLRAMRNPPAVLLQMSNGSSLWRWMCFPVTELWR